MQTIYFETSNFIRHTGNLVDLTEYRRRLARAQAGAAIEEEEPEASAPRESARRRRSRRRANLTGMLLDWSASIALIVVALAFTLKIL